MSGSGLSPQDGAVGLVFNSWGGWRELDSLYLDVLSCTPATDAELFPGNALILQQPEDWDGSFEVQFAIHPIHAGSEAQRRWGMLPTWSPSYSFGQTRNVFPEVIQDRGKVSARTRVELLAPEGMEIASGWGGLMEGLHAFELDPTLGNGFLGFGKPLEVFFGPLGSGDHGSGGLEIIQYGEAHKATLAVAKVVQSIAESIQRTTGVAPIDPSIVFITDVGGGGMGAEFGLVLGYGPEAPDWQMHSPYYQHFVAHEFYHDWLGIRLEANESMVWFHEGFTDYFALWHLASTGVIERTWFASRIHELAKEAIERSSWGEVAFADTEVSWRDGDGPNETMAYKGGAMLAFALDVSLRERGHVGASELIRDLLAQDAPRVDLAQFHTWCLAHDLEDFWESYVAGTGILEPAEWLARIGFAVQAPESAGEDPQFHIEDEDAVGKFLQVPSDRR